MNTPKADLVAALASRYRLEREIGRGGMATVYFAEDLRHHRPVAVKVLHAEIAGSIGAERFLQEIEVAARLSHPNIVPLHDSGEAAGSLYYVMPYLEERSLRELLEKRTCLPVSEAVQIASAVADALEYAHSHDVVHRDIKPENILLQAGHPVVADFGIARALRVASAERLTGEHLAIGTPPYMSPEQAGGDRHVDGRSDIYSLGCVLYEMIAGVLPFSSHAGRLAVPRVSMRALRRPRTGGHRVPTGVELALERALAVNPADRFSSAAEFGRSLQVPVRPWIRYALVATLAIVTLVAGILTVERIRARPASVPALVPQRVVVAEFANRTGKPELDYLGVMASDWITEGLLRTGLVDVVPTETALQASHFSESERRLRPAADPVRMLAEETGAGIVITGSYYREAEQIQIQVQVTGVHERKLLGALGPVRSPLGAPTIAIEGIRTRLMGLLATTLDERLAASVDVPVQPPTFEAYREFSEGLDAYVRTDFPAATERFLRAYQRDTTFGVALLMASIGFSNQQDYAQADSLLGILARVRAQLSPYHRNWLDYRRSLLAGDRAAALRAIRLIAAAAPGSKAGYNQAIEALQNGKLVEAATALASLAPDRGPMRGWSPYWDALGTVRHLLGEYGAELKAGARAREAYPDRPYVLSSTVRALSAIGRDSDLEGVLDAAERMPADPFGVTAGSLALEAGLEQLAHGRPDGSRRLLQRSLDWYATRASTIPLTRPERFARGRAFYGLARWAETRVLATALVAEDATNVEYLSLLGAAAARERDTTEALRVVAVLEAMPRRYSLGRPSLAEARIAAILGRRDPAVALLRRAFAEGHEYDLWLHRDIDLALLRGYPPFDEFVLSVAR